MEKFSRVAKCNVEMCSSSDIQELGKDLTSGGALAKLDKLLQVSSDIPVKLLL